MPGVVIHACLHGKWVCGVGGGGGIEGADSSWILSPQAESHFQNILYTTSNTSH